MHSFGELFNAAAELSFWPNPDEYWFPYKKATLKTPLTISETDISLLRKNAILISEKFNVFDLDFYDDGRVTVYAPLSTSLLTFNRINRYLSKKNLQS